MAGNTRGRLKEHFEGIHKNCNWITKHCEDCLNLIKDKNPKLSKGIKGLAAGIATLDSFAQSIYRKL